MVELSVQFDQEGTQFLVYKQRESRLEGRLVVKTKDKLKVRQISIRLVATELVDFHAGNSSTSGGAGAGSGDAGSSGGAGGSSGIGKGSERGAGLHSYVQKSSRTIGTWAILEKESSAHVLSAGEHRYSFELALPRGLDGSIASRPYTLHYELETRVEHSFKLKPDSTQLTPVELVQVPMALNLHADDRISLAAGPRPAPTTSMLVADDVPLGQALSLAPDMIDQREPFVLHHLWDGGLSLRVRLPHGRAFPAGSNPVLDIEAVPTARNYRCTRFTVALEEITIVARPQRAGAARASASAGGDSSTISSSSNSTLDTPHPSRQSAASRLTSSSEDSLPVSASHNAWAYAQASSAEYRNAITKVRELARTSTRWPQADFGSLMSYHGILVAKPNLRIPPAGQDATHADIRNSHVQIHHQLVYELEYQAINTEEMAVPLQKEPRIRAAAHIYRSLGSANIVRRDRLPESAVPAALAPQTVRGTLPVALVSRRIADLWAIRDLSRDPATEDSPVAAAASGHLAQGAALYPPVHSMPTVSMPKATMPGEPDAEEYPHPSSAGPTRSGSLARPHSPLANYAPAPAYDMPTPVDFGPGMTLPVGVYAQQSPGVYPPEPPRTYSPAPAGVYLPAPAAVYPPAPSTGHPSASASAHSLAPSSIYPPAPAATLPATQGSLAPPGGSSSDAGSGQQLLAGGMAFDPSMFQRQIEAFQEQQRQQQELFFRQLTEQYARMVVADQAQQPPGLSVPGPGTPADPTRSHDGRPLSMASTLCPADGGPGPLGANNGGAQGAPSAADIYAVLDRPLIPSLAPVCPAAVVRTNTESTTASHMSDRQSVHTAEEQPGPESPPLQSPGEAAEPGDSEISDPAAATSAIALAADLANAVAGATSDESAGAATSSTQSSAVQSVVAATGGLSAGAVELDVPAATSTAPPAHPDGAGRGSSEEASPPPTAPTTAAPDAGGQGRNGAHATSTDDQLPPPPRYDDLLPPERYTPQQIEWLFDLVIEEGRTAKKAVLAVGINVRTAQNYVKMYRDDEQGRLPGAAHRPRTGCRGELNSAHTQFLTAFIEKNPATVLADIRRSLCDAISGLAISESALHWHLIDKCCLTLKKLEKLPAARNMDWVVARHAERVAEWEQMASLDYATNCMFIDWRRSYSVPARDMTTRQSASGSAGFLERNCDMAMSFGCPVAGSMTPGPVL
ncbi:hypothetical protein LPJ61_001917, partial [Coemansia biformis]